ncbi:disulfide bond formation protein B [Brucellaceae bacterium C25G]
MSIIETFYHRQSGPQNPWAFFHYIYLLGMMFVIAAILTAAMILQYAYAELPCPLCLLQRIAMLGVCFGVMLQLRYGLTFRYAGITLLFAVFLLIVSVRQTLLDIYVRAGHEYIGSAVFGLHMPVWSILIALALISAVSIQMMVWGRGDDHRRERIGAFPLIRMAALALGLYVVALAGINTVSVMVQCGVGQCHTTGYALLK